MTKPKIIWIESTPSTNLEAWKIESSLENPIIIITNHQIQGRGRGERKWISPCNKKTALTFSIKLKVEKKILTWIPLAASVAVVQSILNNNLKIFENQNFEKLKIKWPNDIFLNDAKAGGILCESKSSENPQSLIVCGIGLNITEHPKLKTPTPSISLVPPIDPPYELSEEEQENLAVLITKNLLKLIEKLSNDKQAIKNEWFFYSKTKEEPIISFKDKLGVLQKIKIHDLDSYGRLLAYKLDENNNPIKLLTLDQPLDDL
jgi:BirA family biotin operon repressor/biotin-[acetyl-CoA-carboxylase] ligase